MRILYLMHVDWRWIKQRPHFLAEELARNHDVQVLYRMHPRRFALPPNRTTVPCRPLLPLPRPIGRSLQRAWVARAIARLSPEIVWLTFPTLLDVLPSNLHGAKLVYDCMDDAAAFFTDPAEAARVVEQEKKLCSAAAQIFCSSQHLADRLAERADLASKTLVIRNALSDAWVARTAIEPVATGPATTIGYIGTVSEWLDVDALRVALNALPEITVQLVGPIAGRDLATLEHPRIVLRGPVAHERLQAVARNFDALVMPFRVTPLVRGVDPVKLYEYLSFGKPVISVRYPEIERFADYVHFYDSHQELIDLLRRAVAGTLGAKASAPMVRSFIETNTWSSRGAAIDTSLKLLGAPRG